MDKAVGRSKRNCGIFFFLIANVKSAKNIVGALSSRIKVSVKIELLKNVFMPP